MSSPQGSEAWLIERAGFATSSRFSDACAKIKNGEAKTRADYRTELAVERLTGLPVEQFVSGDMRRGSELESDARQAYEAHTGVIVDQTGFLKHKLIPWAGCSPDGIIDDDGLVEIKVPKSTTHLAWMEAGKAPPQHIPQIQGQMAVTGRQWCDFMSYDPRFPPNLQLFIVRVERDDAYIKTLELEVKDFLLGVDTMVNRLLSRGA